MVEEREHSLEGEGEDSKESKPERKRKGWTWRDENEKGKSVAKKNRGWVIRVTRGTSRLLRGIRAGGGFDALHHEIHLDQVRMDGWREGVKGRR